MRKSDHTVLLVLFGLSGLAGLIYESIWTHYLKLFLGHAAYAQAIVLAMFMGGMALGSWLSSRRSARWRDPLLAYAAAEAAVGALSLAFHEAFVNVTAVAYGSILPRLAGSPALANACRWSIAAALILPQSVLLGMTFPLMAAGVLRRDPERPGRSVASLYFANSLGAVAGALLSAFVLVRAAGLPGTLRIAAIVNLAVAFEVWRRFRAAPGVTTTAVGGGPVLRADRVLAGFLAVSLVTGASSFVYEVAWTRMLSLVLGASTHSFELMLAAFILGLALGALWVRRRIDQIPNPARTLAIVQVAMGLLALATLPVYGASFDVMRWLMGTLPRTDDGYALFNLSSGAIALAVMLPATTCAGMTLPLVTAALLRRGHGERSIGAVYAANTVGAILAVVAAVHVGMPLLGVKGLLTFGSALDLALGVALAWSSGPQVASRRLTAAIAVVSVIALAVTLTIVRLEPSKLASGVYRFGRVLDEESEQVVLHRDGKTATVSVIADGVTGQVRIATNGKVDAAVTMAPSLPPNPDESTMVLLGVVPMSLAPRATTAACVGFGAGITTHVLLSNPRLATVDTIEIEEEMVRAAQHFRPRNELAYVDPRSRIHIDDAKSFLAVQGRRYDLIVSEPSNPWVSGVAGLFSEEFYQQARRHLAEGGLFVQWIQLYEIYPGLVVSVLKAIENSFSDYAVYAATDNDAIIVARNGGRIDVPDPEVLALPGLAEPLHRIGVLAVPDLERRRIGDRRSWEGLTRSFASTSANSDYYPILDQNAARARFVDRSSVALVEFARDPLPVVDILSPSPNRADTTIVTPSPHFGGAQRAREAMLLRDLVLDTRRAPDALPADVPPEALPFLYWLRRCAVDRPDPLPLVSFRFVARACVPELTPRELEAMWRPLTGGPCSLRLSPMDRAWVEQVVAVSRRDGRRMAVASRVLLEVPDLAAVELRDLVAAGMLGSISAGERAEATRLWADHGRAISTRSDLLLRLLVEQAHSGAGSATQETHAATRSR